MVLFDMLNILILYLYYTKQEEFSSKL